MAGIQDCLASDASFKDINRLFANGVPPEIASALSADNAHASTPDGLYSIDMRDFDQSVIDHFNRDWMGLGGPSGFGPEAGQALYKAYVHALQTAGERQIKGIWIDREEVSVQVMEDDKLVLVILGAPTDRGTPCDDPCGTVFKP